MCKFVRHFFNILFCNMNNWWEITIQCNISYHPVPCKVFLKTTNQTRDCNCNRFIFEVHVDIIGNVFEKQKIRQCRNSPKIQWENFRKKQVKIDTPYTQIHDLSSSWLTQLRTILILWDQISCYGEPFWLSRINYV